MDKSSIYFPEPGEIEPLAMAFAQMMFAHAAFEAEVCQLQGAITGDPDFGEQVHNQWGAQVRPEHMAKLIDQHFGETIPEKAPIVQLLTHAKAPCDDRNLLAHGQWWRFDPNTSTIDVRGGRQRDDGCVEHNRFTVAGIHEIIEKFKNLEAELFKLRRSIADRAHHFRPLLDAAADYVQTEAPRLVKVAGATAISFALFDGVDRALGLANQQDVHGDAYQTALGYRGDTVSLTVVRLAMLLDRNPRVVSFQHIYSHLKRPDAVNLLVDRACHASPLAAALDDRIADDVRASTKRFLEAYEAIDWHNLHGRLQHFRNRGLVHLTPEQISERVSYAEIRSLVRSVTVLAECLTVFDPDGVSVRLDEIDEWSNRAKEIWDAALGRL
jgi:hypothetical protein